MHPNSEPFPSVVRPPPTSLHSLATALRTGGDHLGDLVWWTLSDARLERSTLERMWTANGLAASLLPEPPSAEKALKAAVRECQVGKPDLLIRLGKESDDELVFGFVRETKDGDGNLHHHQESRVTLDRHSESLSADDPDHADVSRLISTFQSLRHTHTADDVRRAVVKALQSFSAVSLRETGGIYWVPYPFAEQLRRLQNAIQRFGSSRLYLLPVHDSDEATTSLGAVARGTLEQELQQLQQEIEQFKAEPPSRASTLERRLQAFTDLRAKANLYRDILSVQVDGLDQQLQDMSAVVDSLLGRLQAA